MLSAALGTCRCQFKLHHFSSIFHHGTHASDTNKASLGHIMLEPYQHHGLIFSALHRIIEEHTKNFSHEQCYTHTYIQTHLHPIVEIIVSRTNTLTVSLSTGSHQPRLV